VLAPLAVYRRALKIAREWPALVGDPEVTEEKTKYEVEYIKGEARVGFRDEANRSLPPDEAQESLTHAMNRMDIALHYKIPYPRIHHTSTGAPDERDHDSAFKTYDDAARNANMLNDELPPL